MLATSSSFSKPSAVGPTFLRVSHTILTANLLYHHSSLRAWFSFTHGFPRNLKFYLDRVYFGAVPYVHLPLAHIKCHAFPLKQRTACTLPSPSSNDSSLICATFPLIHHSLMASSISTFPPIVSQLRVCPFLCLPSPPSFGHYLRQRFHFPSPTKKLVAINLPDIV